MYAPVYPQLTLHALTDRGAITGRDIAAVYASVQAAWMDYLAHYNRGRGVIVIGHSQGASLLIQLLERRVDNNPAVRSRLVSAIILGGNVTVPIGKTVGGSFKHIPACTTTRQFGCVIAYSSFDQMPPVDSLFGRPRSSAGLQVLCVNPGDLSGGTAAARPVLPDQVGSERVGWTIGCHAA